MQSAYHNHQLMERKETPAEKAAREAKEFETWQEELIPPKTEQQTEKVQPKERDFAQEEVDDFRTGRIDHVTM